MYTRYVKEAANVLKRLKDKVVDISCIAGQDYVSGDQSSKEEFPEGKVSTTDMINLIDRFNNGFTSSSVDIVIKEYQVVLTFQHPWEFNLTQEITEIAITLQDGSIVALKR